MLNSIHAWKLFKIKCVSLLHWLWLWVTVKSLASHETISIKFGTFPNEDTWQGQKGDFKQVVGVNKINFKERRRRMVRSDADVGHLANGVGVAQWHFTLLQGCWQLLGFSFSV